MKIKAIKPGSRTQTVHDITVDKESNYVLENGVVTHNSGLKYSASTIVMLSKKKVKEGTEVIGNIIHCKLYKSRLTKENAMVDVMLDYDTGLDQYYGLVDLALKYGIFKKASTRIELPDGTKVYEKSVYKDPEKYFTPEILEQLDEAAAKEYKYGSANRTQNEDDDEDSDETTTD
jgi:hypothetical protein